MTNIGSGWQITQNDMIHLVLHDTSGNAYLQLVKHKTLYEVMEFQNQ